MVEAPHLIIIDGLFVCRFSETLADPRVSPGTTDEIARAL